MANLHVPVRPIFPLSSPMEEISSPYSSDLERDRPFDFLTNATRSKALNRLSRDVSRMSTSGIKKKSKKDRTTRPLGLNITDMPLPASQNDNDSPLVDLNDLMMMSKARERDRQKRKSTFKSRRHAIQKLPDKIESQSNAYADLEQRETGTSLTDKAFPSDDQMISPVRPRIETSSLRKPRMPSIVVTPAPDDGSWPSSPEDERPEKSSIYSQATPHVWLDDTTPVPRSTKHRGAEFLDSRSSLGSRKRRSLSVGSSYGLSRGDVRRSIMDDNGQSPLNDRLSVMTGDDRPASQGWWNELLSPYLDASPATPESGWDGTTLAHTNDISQDSWERDETSTFSPDSGDDKSRSLVLHNEVPQPLSESHDSGDDKSESIILKNEPSGDNHKTSPHASTVSNRSTESNRRKRAGIISPIFQTGLVTELGSMLSEAEEEHEDEPIDMSKSPNAVYIDNTMATVSAGVMHEPKSEIEEEIIDRQALRTSSIYSEEVQVLSNIPRSGTAVDKDELFVESPVEERAVEKAYAEPAQRNYVTYSPSSPIPTALAVERAITAHVPVYSPGNHRAVARDVHSPAAFAQQGLYEEEIEHEEYYEMHAAGYAPRRSSIEIRERGFDTYELAAQARGLARSASAEPIMREDEFANIPLDQRRMFARRRSIESMGIRERDMYTLPEYEHERQRELEIGGRMGLNEDYYNAGVEKRIERAESLGSRLPGVRRNSDEQVMLRAKPTPRKLTWKEKILGTMPKPIPKPPPVVLQDRIMANEAPRTHGLGIGIPEQRILEKDRLYAGTPRMIEEDRLHAGSPFLEERRLMEEDRYYNRSPFGDRRMIEEDRYMTCSPYGDRLHYIDEEPYYAQSPRRQLRDIRDEEDYRLAAINEDRRLSHNFAKLDDRYLHKGIKDGEQYRLAEIDEERRLAREFANADERYLRAEENYAIKYRGGRLAEDRYVRREYADADERYLRDDEDFAARYRKAELDDDRFLRKEYAKDDERYLRAEEKDDIKYLQARLADDRILRKVYAKDDEKYLRAEEKDEIKYLQARLAEDRYLRKEYAGADERYLRDDENYAAKYRQAELADDKILRKVYAKDDEKHLRAEEKDEIKYLQARLADDKILRKVYAKDDEKYLRAEEKDEIKYLQARLADDKILRKVYAKDDEKYLRAEEKDEIKYLQARLADDKFLRKEYAKDDEKHLRIEEKDALNYRQAELTEDKWLRKEHAKVDEKHLRAQEKDSINYRQAEITEGKWLHKEEAKADERSLKDSEKLRVAQIKDDKRVLYDEAKMDEKSRKKELKEEENIRILRMKELQRIRQQESKEAEKSRKKELKEEENIRMLQMKERERIRLKEIKEEKRARRKIIKDEETLRLLRMKENERLGTREARHGGPRGGPRNKYDEKLRLMRIKENERMRLEEMKRAKKMNKKYGREDYRHARDPRLEREEHMRMKDSQREREREADRHYRRKKEAEHLGVHVSERALKHGAERLLNEGVREGAHDYISRNESSSRGSPSSRLNPSGILRSGSEGLTKAESRLRSGGEGLLRSGSERLRSGSDRLHELPRSERTMANAGKSLGERALKEGGRHLLASGGKHLINDFISPVPIPGLGGGGPLGAAASSYINQHGFGSGKGKDHILSNVSPGSYGSGYLASKEQDWRDRSRGMNMKNGPPSGGGQRTGYFLVLTFFFAILIAAVAVAILLSKQRGGNIDTRSEWLNLTEYPPIVTGISTIAGTETHNADSSCVSPSSLWSCALPKEDQASNEPYSPDEPTFRVEILYRNQTTSTNSTQAQRRSNWTSDPSPPNTSDQNFIGNTTDGNSLPYGGEQTPFSISVLSSVNPLSSTSSSLRRRSTLTNLSSIIPSPDENTDGSAAAALLYPLVKLQPIHLYNRGKSEEHYGFYTYYDKSIFLESTAPLDGSTADTNTNDANGGSIKAKANTRCTWSQTRFLVQMWTNPAKMGFTLLSSNNTDTNSTSATNYTRPGSFPYPVTITVDRHGGSEDSKFVYCYEVESDRHYNTSNAKLLAEYRGVGGTLVNPVSTATNESTARWGGVDGGTGGCGCKWVNWISTS